MNSPTRHATCAALEALVRQVPGVTAIYRPGRRLGRTRSAMTRPSTQETGDEPLIRVTNTGGRMHITVEIGISTESATGTCRAVYTTISDWLREQDLREGRVEVTIAHVSDEHTREAPSELPSAAPR